LFYDANFIVDIKVIISHECVLGLVYKGFCINCSTTNNALYITYLRPPVQKF